MCERDIHSCVLKSACISLLITFTIESRLCDLLVVQFSEMK